MNLNVLLKLEKLTWSHADFANIIYKTLDICSQHKKKKRNEKKSPKHWMNLFSHSIGIHKHPEAARLTCSAPNSISKRHFWLSFIHALTVKFFFQCNFIVVGAAILMWTFSRVGTVYLLRYCTGQLLMSRLKPSLHCVHKHSLWSVE